MLEPAATAVAPRPDSPASSPLSRFMRLLLADARAEERRCIARDLHDGAQQRLVHTILALKLARQAGDADEAQQLFDEALEQAKAAERAPVPVDVEVCAGRLPAPVERAAYFVISEALTNVAKHARTASARVSVRWSAPAARPAPGPSVISSWPLSV